MSLILTIDKARWAAHQLALIAEVPGLVPVAKGNGYGFGLRTLAAQSAELGVDVIAVGIAQEVAEVRAGGWTGDVVVLNPWRPFDDVATALLDDEHVITTVSRAEDIRALSATHPKARVIVEIVTSMRRHGLTPGELTRGDFDRLRLEGWAVHLPAGGSLEEARRLSREAQSVAEAPMWLSHLSVADYRVLASQLHVPTRMRVGTRLWLGSKSAYRTTATVLDVHPAGKGSKLGYHQVSAPKAGFILVISGGTAHGVAMAAPVPQRSLKQRGVTVMTGVLDALERTRSPFTISGRKRDFAEPPHMHSSMIFIAGPDPLVKVGDEVAVTTRMTTVTCDEIRWA